MKWYWIALILGAGVAPWVTNGKAIRTHPHDNNAERPLKEIALQMKATPLAVVGGSTRMLAHYTADSAIAWLDREAINA